MRDIQNRSREEGCSTHLKTRFSYPPNSWNCPTRICFATNPIFSHGFATSCGLSRSWYTFRSIHIPISRGGSRGRSYLATHRRSSWQTVCTDDTRAAIIRATAVPATGGGFRNRNHFACSYSWCWCVCRTIRLLVSCSLYLAGH